MGRQPFGAEEVVDPSFAAEVTPDVERLRTCVHCGSCTAACPTAARMGVSPQRLVRLLKLGLREEALATQSFWRCTSCRSCSQSCPRGIPVLETMIGLKSYSIRNRRGVPEDVELLRRTIASSRNVSGDPNETRLVWTANLPQPLAAAGGASRADVLFFVGCIGSFYPRAFSIPQAFARVLEVAGVRAALLGSDEWCCGYPLHNVGLADDMGELVEHNVERLRRLGTRTLVTTCASCYYTWKRVYPSYAALPQGLTVLHAVELLAELVDAGRLRPAPAPRVVTYHDPCDLGRKGGQYDAPRHVLRSLPGVELREMASIRESALCCGGGGDVKIFSYDTTMEAARRRAEQALDVGADTIVSACQQCKRALVGAVQSMRQPVRVLDVAELVWESLAEGVRW